MSQPVARPEISGPERGFTLIEIMVVIVIIAVFSTAVIMNLRLKSDADIAKQNAERLLLIMQTAAEEALLFADNYGIIFEPEGYKFLKLEYREVDAKAAAATEPEAEPEPEPEPEPSAAADAKFKQNLPKLDKRRFEFVWQPMAIGDKKSIYRDYQLSPEIGRDYYFEVLIEGLAVSLESDTFAKFNASETKLKPTIIFTADGEIVPDFEVRLVNSRDNSYFRLRLDQDGVLQLVPSGKER